MNAQERAVLDLFGQRLDDHIRSCEGIHKDIKDDVKDARADILRISAKVDDVMNITSRQSGGQAAVSWMVMLGVALLSAAVSITGVVAGIIIQITLK